MKIALLILLVICGSAFAEHQHTHVHNGHVHNHLLSGQDCPEERIQNQLYNLQKNVNDLRENMGHQHILLGTAVFLNFFIIIILFLSSQGKKKTNGKGVK